MPELTAPYVARIITRGDVLGQEALQVWYYAAVSYDDGISAWLASFKLAVVDHLLDAMSNQAHIVTIEGQMVKGSNDFDTFNASVGGNISGDCLPPFASWDFTLLRGGGGERNGYKRIQGVPESKQVDGIATASAYADLTSLAGFMAASITVSLDEMFPCIRRTRINHAAQNPPKYFNVSDVQYSKIGTQNTRKFGRGR